MAGAHAAALAAFDIEGVVARAEAALAAGGATGLEEARKLFEETLAAWGDEYGRLLEEADPPLAAPEDRKPFEERLVGLWLAYAGFERKLRQWKQAVKVFESATTDAVGERSTRLWLEYAAFCRERGKVANAQKVYLRAVELLQQPDECEAIWQAFLGLVREKGTAGVDTVAQLKAMLGIAASDAAAAAADTPAAAAAPEPAVAPAPVPPAKEEQEAPPEPPAVKVKAEGMDVDEAPVKERKEEEEAQAPPEGMEGVEAPPPPPQEEKEEAKPEAAAVAPPVAPAEEEEEEPTGPVPLLFPSEALTVEDAYGHGLAPEVLERVQALLQPPPSHPPSDGEGEAPAPPPVLPVLEGQRLIQALKQKLAAKLVQQQQQGHEERARQLSLRHAAMAAAARPNPLPPHVAAQVEAERAQLAGAVEAERAILARQLRAELGALLAAQQAALGEGPGGAGLPLVTPTRDGEAVARQQRVVRAVLANLQMYQAGVVALAPLKAEVARRQGWLQAMREAMAEAEKKGAAGAAGGGGAGGGGAPPGRLELPPPTVLGGGEAGGGSSSSAPDTNNNKRVTRGTRGGAKRAAAALGGGPGSPAKSNKAARTGAAASAGRRRGARGRGGGAGGGGEGEGEDRRAILRSMMAHFQGGSGGGGGSGSG